MNEIDKRLQAEFPDYAALVGPAPLAVEGTQAQLASDEALVLVVDTPEMKPTHEETFLWVVTKTEARWVRSEVGTQSLVREVVALRCGLDAALWDDEPAAARCRELVKSAPERDAFAKRPDIVSRSQMEVSSFVSLSLSATTCHSGRNFMATPLMQ